MALRYVFKCCNVLSLWYLIELDVQIPQLYVHHPASAGEPPSVLKGFDDIFLKHGQRTTVTIALSRYDLSIWDVVAQGWKKPTGTITFSVGASSRDFRLSGTIPL